MDKNTNLDILKSGLHKSISHKKRLIIILGIIFVIIFIISLFLGRYFISPLNIVRMILGMGDKVEEAEWSIFFLIRLPRVIIVSIIGMALSISGHIYQSMFRNPLVSPNILGVSAGSSFGAALGIILPLNFPYLIEISAFGFGILAVTISYNISRLTKTSPVLVLILAGIIVSSFFNSLLSFLKYISDPYNELPSITYWIMGGFFKSTWNETITVIIFIIPVMIILLLLSNQLNLLSLGDDDAIGLGLEVKRLRKVFIVLTTFIVALSVSVCGAIAWVGLIIPHISRTICGSNHYVSLPATMLIGAVTLLFADNIARTITSGEIPIGILISFVGAPFFAYLLIKIKSARGFREN